MIVAPGEAAKSELLRRILAKGDERMPPVASDKGLDKVEIATLERWIEEGAKWSAHWAFVPPRRPTLPKLPASRDSLRAGAVSHPIDRFVRAKLLELGIAASPPATRAELIRRLSFDLIGLPPSPAELAAFVADRRPGAYERLVDRLLASPKFGERMAMSWLEAARYSDTDGYQQDAMRSNWPWRDWVVRAYNDNVPFDRFTIEQFAGDLLDDASAEQVLATCFHRNHMTNGEGGRHAEESRVDYVLDRVNTTGTLWLGLTLGCAQCHDHKYDPVSQGEYYGLAAFFNSIDETGQAGNRARPYLDYKSSSVADGRLAADAWLRDRERDYQAELARGRQRFEPWLASLARELGSKARHDSFVPLRASSLASAHGATLRQGKDAVIVVTGENTRHEDLIVEARPGPQRLTALRITLLPFADGQGEFGLSLAEDGHALLTNIDLELRSPGAHSVRELAVRRAIADHEFAERGQTYGRVRDVLDDDPRNGWWTRGRAPSEARTALLTLAEAVEIGPDDVLTVSLRQRSLRGYATPRRVLLEFCSELGPAAQRIGVTPREALVRRGDVAELSVRERRDLLDEFLAGDQGVQAARARRDRARRRRDRYVRAERPQKVMVMRERKKPRETHVLLGGVWDKKGARVHASVPAALGRLEGKARSRLDLARWLVSGQHPLTARVAVNRYWQALFGRGLVRTPEDFGVQGARPDHPDLLDWLAVEFVESAWDIKAMLRLIVTSETYRQSSRRRADVDARDPENRWLARQSRFRLPSWMLRDAALAAGGLLQPRRGGPPVFPAQPDGVWADSTMGRLRYSPSVGDDLYRRSLYGFWRRLAGPPSMFDASKRRVCRVRVVRTNTPMHALTLLNDEGFADAALALAMRVASRPADPARVDELYRRVLSRAPDAVERRRLVAFVAAARAQYAQEPQAARLVTERARGVAQARGLLRELDAAMTALQTRDEPSKRLPARAEQSDHGRARDEPRPRREQHTQQEPATDRVLPAERELRFAAWALAASLVLNLDEALNRG